jgi:hypothetical protein
MSPAGCSCGDWARQRDRSVPYILRETPVVWEQRWLDGYSTARKTTVLCFVSRSSRSCPVRASERRGGTEQRCGHWSFGNGACLCAVSLSSLIATCSPSLLPLPLLSRFSACYSALLPSLNAGYSVETKREGVDSSIDDVPRGAAAFQLIRRQRHWSC